MTPVNIQRDGTYTKLTAVPLTLSTPGAINGLTANSNGAVNIDIGFASYDIDTPVTLLAEQASTFGVIMTQPRGDRHPYRVKIHAQIADGREQQENPTLALVIGHTVQAPTGIDDVLQNQTYFPIPPGSMSDLIVIEEEEMGDPLEDNPVFFGIAVIGETTAATFAAHISVQNLGVKPPTMQNAIS